MKWTEEQKRIAKAKRDEKLLGTLAGSAVLDAVGKKDSTCGTIALEVLKRAKDWEVKTGRNLTTIDFKEINLTQ
jgi:hypothetical protein